VPDSFVDELLERVAEFARAYRCHGLSVEEFGEYGPVEYFRHMFIEAWNNASGFISNARKQS